MSGRCNRGAWGDDTSTLRCVLPADHEAKGHVYESGTGSQVESLPHEDDEVGR